MRFYITSQEDELQHYGVIGMKWGVRRGDRSKAFAKSAQKADRLKRKAVKYREKSEKNFAKSANFYLTDFGKARNERRRNKSAKFLKKSRKYEKKAARWMKTMNKEFANVKAKDISKEHLEIGREYVNMLMK